jgi:hypothetical protein
LQAAPSVHLPTASLHSPAHVHPLSLAPFP